MNKGRTENIDFVKRRKAENAIYFLVFAVGGLCRQTVWHSEAKREQELFDMINAVKESL